MSLLGDDSVVFEDALGTSQRVCWEICQHPKVGSHCHPLHYLGSFVHRPLDFPGVLGSPFRRQTGLRHGEAQRLSVDRTPV